jgi:hypothetical protein
MFIQQIQGLAKRFSEYVDLDVSLNLDVNQIFLLNFFWADCIFF